MPPAVLAFDTSAPTVSVAVAAAGELLAMRQGAQRESSAHLIRWIDEALAEAGLALTDLAGLVALAGPGSFTGLRVGLATALGLHQALDLPVAALPTLAVLAAAAPQGAVPPGQRVLSLVAAQPGEWYVQAYDGSVPPAAAGDPMRLPLADLTAFARAAGAVLLIGAPGVDLAEPARASGLPSLEAAPLATVAARQASLRTPVWDAAPLATPLYLAPAPAMPAAVPKRVRPTASRGAR